MAPCPSRPLSSACQALRCLAAGVAPCCPGPVPLLPPAFSTQRPTLAPLWPGRTVTHSLAYSPHSPPPPARPPARPPAPPPAPAVFFGLLLLTVLLATPFCFWMRFGRWAAVAVAIVWLMNTLCMLGGLGESRRAARCACCAVCHAVHAAPCALLHWVWVRLAPARAAAAGAARSCPASQRKGKGSRSLSSCPRPPPPFLRTKGCREAASPPPLPVSPAFRTQNCVKSSQNWVLAPKSAQGC